MSDAPKLANLMTAVEGELAAYYDFPVLAPVAAHVISRDELSAALGNQAQNEPEWAARAGVWMIPDNDGAFIGVTLDEPLKECLASMDPRTLLDNGNLDAYCILIEEVSHFHLLLNRLAEGRPVTRSELELQGELDKLLICAKTLKRQCGDYNVVPLARTLYDRAEIIASDPEPYVQATRYAARFWFGQGDEGPDGARVRERLRALYRADWSEKRRSA